jgi:hypothetical protein
MSSTDENIRLRGEDVVNALRESVRQEIIRGPSLYFDLGKFFFSVSIGSIGFLTTFLNIDPKTDLDLATSTSLSLFAVSLILALVIILPTSSKFDAEADDLFEDYEKLMRRLTRYIFLWFIIWMTAVIVAIYSIVGARQICG